MHTDGQFGSTLLVCLKLPVRTRPPGCSAFVTVLASAFCILHPYFTCLAIEISVALLQCSIGSCALFPLKRTMRQKLNTGRRSQLWSIEYLESESDLSQTISRHDSGNSSVCPNPYLARLCAGCIWSLEPQPFQLEPWGPEDWPFFFSTFPFPRVFLPTSDPADGMDGCQGPGQASFLPLLPLHLSDPCHASSTRD